MLFGKCIGHLLLASGYGTSLPLIPRVRDCLERVAPLSFSMSFFLVVNRRRRLGRRRAGGLRHPALGAEGPRRGWKSMEMRTYGLVFLLTSWHIDLAPYGEEPEQIASGPPSN